MVLTFTSNNIPDKPKRKLQINFNKETTHTTKIFGEFWNTPCPKVFKFNPFPSSPSLDADEKKWFQCTNMVYGAVNYRYNINLQDNNIEFTDSLKILGVTLDKRITFKPYILEQLKKACAKAAALRKLRKVIPQDVMIRLYKAYVLPHCLQYCKPTPAGNK